MLRSFSGAAVAALLHHRRPPSSSPSSSRASSFAPALLLARQAALASLPSPLRCSSCAAPAVTDSLLCPSYRRTSPSLPASHAAPAFAHQPLRYSPPPFPCSLHLLHAAPVALQPLGLALPPPPSSLLLHACSLYSAMLLAASSMRCSCELLSSLLASPFQLAFSPLLSLRSVAHSSQLSSLLAAPSCSLLHLQPCVAANPSLPPLGLHSPALFLRSPMQPSLSLQALAALLGLHSPSRANAPLPFFSSARKPAHLLPKHFFFFLYLLVSHSFPSAFSFRIFCPCPLPNF